MPSSTLAEKPTERQQIAQGCGNVRLYVARVDFAAIRAGEKRMWRSYRRGTVRDLPRPVIVCSHHPATGRIDTALSCLIETWTEPLGAISEEHVREEGFETRSAFKSYFAERYPNYGFRPLDTVQVFRVRPLTDDDRDEWFEQTWQRLYGSFA